MVSVSSFSKYCDYVFIINDEQYGGYIKGTQKLSPTSEAMIEISDAIIALGGGNIAKDEYQAAKQKNKSATFYPFWLFQSNDLASDSIFNKIRMSIIDC